MSTERRSAEEGEATPPEADDMVRKFWITCGVILVILYTLGTNSAENDPEPPLTPRQQCEQHWLENKEQVRPITRDTYIRRCVENLAAMEQLLDN